MHAKYFPIPTAESFSFFRKWKKLYQQNCIENDKENPSKVRTKT